MYEKIDQAGNSEYVNYHEENKVLCQSRDEGDSRLHRQLQQSEYDQNKSDEERRINKEEEKNLEELQQNKKRGRP